MKFNLHTYLQSSYCSIFRQMSNLISQWRGTERNLSSTCLTFCIQHLGDVQVLFSNIKGGVQISHWVVLSESKHQSMGHGLSYCWSLYVVRGSGNVSPCAVYRNQWAPDDVCEWVHRSPIHPSNWQGERQKEKCNIWCCSSVFSCSASLDLFPSFTLFLSNA